MIISKRLKCIADLIQKYKEGDVLGDIGSDHAYLPCYLIENKIVEYTYACDVAKGPLDSAIENINYYGLNDKVKPLLGSGLIPIKNKDVDMVSISGMGAYLICDIFNQSMETVHKTKVFFLQANANIDHLRAYLFEHDFMIIDEEIIKEGNHIYEILVVKKNSEKINYSQDDIDFGPILLKKQPQLFKDKWLKQIDVLKKIQDTIDPTHQKHLEIDKKIKQVERILYESK